jgi:hypothetical protein
MWVDLVPLSPALALEVLVVVLMVVIAHASILVPAPWAADRAKSYCCRMRVRGWTRGVGQGWLACVGPLSTDEAT